MSPHLHGQWFFGEPQQSSFGTDSGGVQQHFSSATAELGRKCEMLLLQLHPSHRQNPTGAAMLNNIATMITQAIHWRKDKTPIAPIISSGRRFVNNFFRNNFLDGKPKISEFRQVLGLQISLFMVK
jgi:hypothetical protein